MKASRSDENETLPVDVVSWATSARAVRIAKGSAAIFSTDCDVPFVLEISRRG